MGRGRPGYDIEVSSKWLCRNSASTNFVQGQFFLTYYANFAKIFEQRKFPHPRSAHDNWSDCTQICLNIIRSSWPVRKAVPRLLISKGNYSPCLGKKGMKKHRTRSCELEWKNSIVESGSWSSNVIKEFSIECHKKEANQGCHWVITTIWRKNLVTEQRSSVLKLILILSVNLVKLEKKACCVCVPD